jgi:hypothetical protein
MADIAEIERRVVALETDKGRDLKGLRNDVQGLRDDVQGLQRDIQTTKREAQQGVGAAGALAGIEAQIAQVHTRVVANELVANANTRLTEKGFAEVNGRLDRMETEIGAVKSELKADVAALRRDLPSMIAETMREVLKESRG